MPEKSDVCWWMTSGWYLIKEDCDGITKSAAGFPNQGDVAQMIQLNVEYVSCFFPKLRGQRALRVAWVIWRYRKKLTKTEWALLTSWELTGTRDLRRSLGCADRGHVDSTDSTSYHDLCCSAIHSWSFHFGVFSSLLLDTRTQPAFLRCH